MFELEVDILEINTLKNQLNSLRYEPMIDNLKDKINYFLKRFFKFNNLTVDYIVEFDYDRKNIIIKGKTRQDGLILFAILQAIGEEDVK